MLCEQAVALHDKCNATAVRVTHASTYVIPKFAVSECIGA